MRVFIAGLLGGIVFFAWAAVAHMALPIGEMGMERPASEDAVLAALKDNMTAEGIYIVPGLSGEQMADAAAVAAYSAKAPGNPQAFVVYQPQGEDGMQMGDNLGKQFASDTLSALIVAWVLSLGAFGFGRRVLIAGALGLFSWLSINVPYWNWYRFPGEFTAGALIEQVLGWLLAGMAIAWWLGRTERR
jgi:hypothetical protein